MGSTQEMGGETCGKKEPQERGSAGRHPRRSRLAHCPRRASGGGHGGAAEVVVVPKVISTPKVNFLAEGRETGDGVRAQVGRLPFIPRGPRYADSEAPCWHRHRMLGALRSARRQHIHLSREQSDLSPRILTRLALAGPGAGRFLCDDHSRRPSRIRHSVPRQCMLGPPRSARTHPETIVRPPTPSRCSPWQDVEPAAATNHTETPAPLYSPRTDGGALAPSPRTNLEPLPHRH